MLTHQHNRSINLIIISVALTVRGQFYYDANFALYNVAATALVRVLRLFGDSRAPLHDPSAHRISLSRYPML